MTATELKQPPIRLAYDITRLSAGGVNGGIKAHHFEFLRWLAFHRWETLSLLILCQAEVAWELDFLTAAVRTELHILGPRGDRDFRNQPTGKQLPTLHFWGDTPPDQLLRKLGVECLYCGFGASALADPAIPQISLLVDCLHADQPEFLPAAERGRRDALYRDAIARSALVQTNSDFCAASLVRHFGADPAKILRIYLPLLDRFNRVEMAPPNERLADHKYFFYPANHWPHKNHEALLVAYAKYRTEAGEEPWDLVLTGSETERTRILRETCAALGIAEHVLFLGHLELGELKTAWELCGALVFPSLYEGFGLPLLEAMHFQKHIVAGRVASIPEICGETIHYCEPRNPADLARAMTEVAQLPSKGQAYPDRMTTFQMEREGERLCQAILRAAGRSAIPA